MNRTYEFLRDDRVTGDPLPAAELNALVRILDRQVHGALQGISDGVVTGGVVAAGSGLSVTVTALQAILASTNGYTYLQTDSTLTVSSLPINETVYIWASAIWSDGPGEEDSRETAQVLLEWSYSDDLADAVLLAEVTTGGASVSTVTDQRTFIPLQDLVLRVAALETAAVSVEEDLADIEEDLGTGYWVDGEPVPGEISIHERLEDLEMGGGGGGGGTVYWGSLAKTSGDITSIEEYVAGQVGSGGGGGGGGGTGDTTVVQMPSDIEISNHLRVVLRLIHALPEIEETQRYSYYFVPGISAAALYDAVATTAPVNTATHTIG